MKRHVLAGAETLEQARDYVGRGSFMDMAAEIARYHHEKFDGSGYCAGLARARDPAFGQNCCPGGRLRRLDLASRL